MHFTPAAYLDDDGANDDDDDDDDDDETMFGELFRCQSNRVYVAEHTAIARRQYVNWQKMRF